MITCPRCSLSHKPSVEFCDCGYNLAPLRRARQVLGSGAEVRESAYRWLKVLLVLLKWSAVPQLLVGSWFAVMFVMDGQLLVGLVAGVLTALSLIPYLAASTGIVLLLHLSEQQRIMQAQLSELQRSRP
jgi:hypothetical protein